MSEVVCRQAVVTGTTDSIEAGSCPDMFSGAAIEQDGSLITKDSVARIRLLGHRDRTHMPNGLHGGFADAHTLAGRSAIYGQQYATRSCV